MKVIAQTPLRARKARVSRVPTHAAVSQGMAEGIDCSSGGSPGAMIMERFENAWLEILVFICCFWKFGRMCELKAWVHAEVRATLQEHMRDPEGESDHKFLRKCFLGLLKGANAFSTRPSGRPEFAATSAVGIAPIISTAAAGQLAALGRLLCDKKSHSADLSRRNIGK